MDQSQIELEQIKDRLIFTEYEYEQNGQLLIDIIDTGRGISNSENLFKPFQQESEDIQKNYGGTGLGLWISKQIIEKMNGQIKLVSFPKFGTTIQIILEAIVASSNFDSSQLYNFPILIESPITPQLNQFQKQFKQNNKYKHLKVLVSDQEDQHSDFICNYFENLNIKVFEERDEVRTISTFKIQNDISIVFLSSQYVSGANGIEVAFKIRKCQLELFKKKQKNLQSNPQNKINHCETSKESNSPYTFIKHDIQDISEQESSSEIEFSTQKEQEQLCILVCLVNSYMEKERFDQMQSCVDLFMIRPVKQEQLNQVLKSYVSKSNEKKQNILIVDDEAFNLQVQQSLLEMLGLKVITAIDGNSAFQIIQQHHNQIDFVFTDWEMPEMEGIVMIQKVREFEKSKNLDKIPFCIVSGNQGDSYEKEAKEKGADFYIVKPLRLEKIKEILKYANVYNNEVEESQNKYQINQDQIKMDLINSNCMYFNLYFNQFKNQIYHIIQEISQL